MILNYLAEGVAKEMISLGNTDSFFLMSLFNLESKSIELQSINLKAKKYKRVFDVKPLTCDQKIKVGSFEIPLLQTYLAVSPLLNDPKNPNREESAEERAASMRYQTLFTINSNKFIYMIIEQKENWFEEQIKQENLYVSEIGRGTSDLVSSNQNCSIIHLGFDLDDHTSFVVMSKVGEQGYIQVFRGSENDLGRATIDVDIPKKPFNLKIFGSDGIFTHVEYMRSSDTFALMGIFAERSEGSNPPRYYFCCKLMAFERRLTGDGRKSTEIREIKTLRQEVPSQLSESGKLFEVCARNHPGGMHQFMILIKNTPTILRLTLTPVEAGHRRIAFEQIDLTESLGDFELETGQGLRVSAIASKPDEEGRYLIGYDNKYCEMLLKDY
jgi:hypothetical protein